MKYVIYSPPYRDNSAGIRVLYELQKRLIRMGEDAFVVNAPIPVNDTDILIIPEIADSALFDAKNVVRYYLNVPMKSVSYKEDEFPVKYNDSDYGECYRLYIDVTEDYFCNMELERPFITYYVGKGKFTSIPEVEVPNCKELSLSWPPTRPDVADWLNKCSEIYIYDDKTMLIKEANLCGCNIIFVKNGKTFPQHNIKNDYGNYLDVLEFIRLTKERFCL